MGSEHPIAKAILNAARVQGSDYAFKGQTQAHRGLGIEATDMDQHIAIGSQRFLERIGISQPENVSNAVVAICSVGETPVFVSMGKKIIGLISIEDKIRPESPKVIKQLQTMGIERIIMFTGDSKEVAYAIARQCAIPMDEVNAELLPDQKQEYLHAFQKKGHGVCYVGDGTNDGPVLAQADIGVSIGSREDTVALETSHVVLMREGLEHLTFFFALGRHTKKIININLLFAISFSFIMMILATIGIITPIFGAIAHNLGSITVILNSARLTRFNI